MASRTTFRACPRPRTPKNTIKARHLLKEGDRIPLYVDVKLPIPDLAHGRSVHVSLNGQRITMNDQYSPLAEDGVAL